MLDWLFIFLNRIKVVGRRSIKSAFFALSILFLLFAGVLSALSAFAIEIAHRYGSSIAALCLAGVFLLLAAILFFIDAARRHRETRWEAMRLAATPSSSSVAQKGLASVVLPAMLRASPVGTLLLVAAGSFLIARGIRKDM